MAKKRSRQSEAPELTPLIDVVFLLLIFFMVSTVFKKDELSLLLSLPKSSELKEIGKKKDEHYIIEVTEKEIAFNKQKTSIEKIHTYLKKVTKKTSPIELRIDQNVKYNRVIDILDKLKKFELSNIELVTDKK